MKRHRWIQLFLVLLLLVACTEPGGDAQEPPPSEPTSGPDLTVVNVVLDPIAAPSGAQVSVNSEIRNIGTVETDDAAIGYYLSEDESLDESDTILADDEISDLEPGESEPESESLSLPELAAGDYYLLVVIDTNQVIVEGREDNNVGFAPLRITGTSVIHVDR